MQINEEINELLINLKSDAYNEIAYIIDMGITKESMLIIEDRLNSIIDNTAAAFYAQGYEMGEKTKQIRKEIKQI